MKKILFGFAVFIISLLVFSVNSKNTYADMGPPIPDCANISQNTGQPGCGIIFISGKLDISGYTDRFVFLVEHDYYDAPEGYTDAVAYDIQKDNLLDLGDYFRLTSKYIAVDKQYFDTQGGLNGIFNISKFQYSGDITYDSMTLKDPTAFAKNSYTLVVSNDDKYLGGQPDNQLIDGKYSNYLVISDYTAPITTPNLNCSESMQCKATVTYVLQMVQENYIIITPSKVEYNPSNATQPAAYKGGSSSSTQPQIQTNQSSSQNIVVPPNQNPTPIAPVVEQHVSWWARMWRAIGNFFNHLFK